MMMDDGGWTLGLATLIAIFGGAAAYAAVFLWFMPKLDLPPQEGRTPPKEDLRAVLRWQADVARKEAAYREAFAGLDRWVEIAIRHLMHLWPSMTYDEAAREMRDYLEDAIKAWPSKEWDWSDDAAREMAVEYTREFGEQYGANA